MIAYKLHCQNIFMYVNRPLVKIPPTRQSALDRPLSKKDTGRPSPTKSTPFSLSKFD
jgi:hypothetical protein